jgi:hypothetical protein
MHGLWPTSATALVRHPSKLSNIALVSFVLKLELGGVEKKARVCPVSKDS